ncbi:permease [Methanobacterium sp.]|uniref:permease n=1 Tax=Methanobacterium sp. TaxID=2164 RepID=UPI002ABAB549|nr:permease [Methanobacterium sp.]MDY9923642.1 permease [Methanobacterium sp.]
MVPDILQEGVNYLTYVLMGLDPTSALGSAVNFFIYDTIKILILLTVIIFAIAFFRSYISPIKVRKALAKRNEYVGNVAAALVGIITPFCSCSAVPLFIGFVESGVPLGVTFSFLIASPMVNEIAIILLWGMLGWQITALYIISGLIIAIIAGIIIGKLKLEGEVESYVYEMIEKIKAAEKAGITLEEEKQTPKERLLSSRDYTLDLLKKIGPYVVIAIGIGAIIHGYAPADFLIKYAGPGNPLAVPIAVLIGVPLYSNAAGIIPLVAVFIEKGIPIGTALAFMMAVTALSLPEMIILRKVLKPKLLAIFIGILAVSITSIGYLFNAIIYL